MSWETMAPALTVPNAFYILCQKFLANSVAGPATRDVWRKNL